MAQSNFKLICLLLAVALVGSTKASIDSNPNNGTPVKVTHKNSGPSYDIEVERTRINPNENGEEEGANIPRMPMSPMRPAPMNDGDNEEPTIGHVSIRRVFLFPMMHGNQQEKAMKEETSESSNNNNQEDDRSARRFIRLRPIVFDANAHSNNEEESPRPSPFWPFMAGSNLHHLLGQDSASRSPSAEPERGVEKPTRNEERVPSGLIDPVQMLLEMMQHAMNSAAMMPAPQQPKEPKAPTDLSKDASSNEANGETNNKDYERENQMTPPTVDPFKPISKPSNETKEEVVEIEGKKFLRKSVINRHVGPGIIFMTRRLIFVPLNETSGDAESTTTAPTMTTTPMPIENQTTTTVAVSSEEPSKKQVEQQSTTSSTTTTTELPSSTTTEMPTTTNALESSSSKPEVTTTSKEWHLEKDSSDRLVSPTTL